jgi:small subunit ribosomal protein S3
LKADIDYGFSEAKTTYGVIGVKCWVYRGDRLANGDAPNINTPAGAEDDRRNRRGPRPGGPSGPGGAPGSRPRSGPGTVGERPLRAAAGSDRHDKSLDPGSTAAAPDVSVPGAGDPPKGPAVKRVRKAVAPPPAADSKSDGKGE